MSLAVAPAAGQYLLVPMDAAQSNHLKAYGLTYHVLESGQTAEWLLNYRHGSFLLPDVPTVRREAALRGVTVLDASLADVAALKAEIERANMEVVVLEKAPEIAIYTPPNASPWDDAVTLALDYAEIPYDEVWDAEVLQGRLSEYDWLHLHHEDFTGQYSKFFINFAGTVWLQEEVARNEAVAREFDAPHVPALKKRVAEEIRNYVAEGGFLFAMCTATETIDLALAAEGVDIAAPFSDGTPADPRATERMDWARALAFQGAEVQTNSAVNAFSDIDGHQVNTAWKQPLGSYTLFDFSAKFDPVPSMLVQNHEGVVADFYGLTTSFRRDRLKPGVVVLAQEEGSPWVKYIHGTFNEGTWTFLGGHDPEDAQHEIGDEPTNLDMHPHSPGYRLILNNVLFPAAKKKTLKTD
ncbi:MAG: asparagine synthetase B [Gemmatimonadetes bacterium]|nr:asparagine synthetase B [Gemmatimonadota bacterium]